MEFRDIKSEISYLLPHLVFQCSPSASSGSAYESREGRDRTILSSKKTKYPGARPDFLFCSVFIQKFVLFFLIISSSLHSSH